MDVVWQAQMRAHEEAMIAAGMPGLLLMEHAASAVAAAAAKIAGQTAEVLFVCGGGNNGGDGLAAARLFAQRGGRPKVFLFSKPEALTPDSLANYRALVACGIKAIQLSDQEVFPALDKEMALIVDALVGTGLTGALRLRQASIVTWMMAQGIPVLAVDVPSGMQADSGKCDGVAVEAVHTVTFGWPKPGHLLPSGRKRCGVLEVADIGLVPRTIHSPLWWMEQANYHALMPTRALDAHKGTAGHLLIVAGSTGMAGAAIFAAKGALRAGAGLVTVACPEAIVPILQTTVPEAMAIGLSADDGAISHQALPALEKAMAGKDAVLIGPGISRRMDVRVLESTLEAKKVVLDADALNLLAEHHLCAQLHDGCVVTPHPGELSRLIDMPLEKVVDAPLEAIAAYTARYPGVLIAKGATSIVAWGERRTFITAGSPAMAKGGSGDVLAGMMGALIMQKENAFDAACCAAYWHASAGAEAAKRNGMLSACPQNILDGISEVYFTILGA